MAKSFKDWLSEGEQLYTSAIEEYHELESQLEELETRLSEKMEEVNQIAHVVGKPPVEGTVRNAGVQIVESHSSGSIPASRNTIAKALTGRGLS